MLRGLEIIPPPDIEGGLSGHDQVLLLREGLNKAIASFTSSILRAEHSLHSDARYAGAGI